MGTVGKDPSEATPVASYDIRVSLDVEAKTLAGSQLITYANLTEQPIPDLVFHLYLNAFRDLNSYFLRESGPQHRGFSWTPDEAGRIEVTRLSLAGGAPLALEPLEDGTLARAALPAPVEPGGSIQIEVDFSAQLPRVFARTGYAGDFFMVGQWFPKLAVWEDGAWNAYPFYSNAEFYANFGDYNVSITLPDGYVTGGTGLPVSRTTNADGSQTVVYAAQGVIDFAWTASPHFREATRRVEGVEVLYLYLPEHAWTVGTALDAAEAAVTHFGRWFGPYPYARLTVVDVPEDGGGAGGMEYPTLVTAGAMNPLGPGFPASASMLEGSLAAVTIHEIGHQWWQSMAAFNEAEEPWLDEGFTDYSTVRLMERVYDGDMPMLRLGGWELGYLDLRRLEYLTNPTVPMYGRAWDFAFIDYGVAAYSKPAISLMTLEGVLGEEVMLDVMSTFFERYRFDHPNTEDFRAVAQEVSGQDLDWFFEGLVYGGEVVNYTVSSVGEQQVTVERQGGLSIPTEVLVTFEDGSTLIEPWDGLESTVTFSYPDRPPVSSALVDPERKILVDLQWVDNGLARRMQVESWLAVAVRLLYQVQNALMAVGGL